MVWLEMERVINKYIANCFFTLLNSIQNNEINNDDTHSRIKQVEKKYSQITKESLNHLPFTEDEVEEYFAACNWKDSDYVFHDDPHVGGTFKNGEDFDNFAETYSIFIDFSDPNVLFEEIKEKIKEEIVKENRSPNYWAINFGEDIFGRLIAPSQDLRSVDTIEMDFDRFWSGIFELLDMDEQELEYYQEDLYK
jgi:hypothetical protein